jgi:type II secretory pathway component PulF
MKRKADFFKVLSWLLKSGLPLYQALELMAHQGGNPTIKTLLRQIRAGHSLSDSMKQSRRFRMMECNAVMAGESSGALADKLLSISLMIEREGRMKRATVDAMSYPLIVLLSALGALFVMAGVVTPMLADITRQSGQELPLLTRALISFSQALPEAGASVLFTTPLILTLLHLAGRNRQVKLKLWRLLLSAPLLGSWIQRSSRLALCLNLSMLLEAGIQLHQAFNMLSEKGLPFPYRAAMSESASGLLSGMSLHACLRDELLFDPVMRHLLMAAEKSGELHQALHSLAIYYEEELSRQALILRNRLEPLMIALSGIVVALVVLGFYLPMFELGSNMGR